MIPAFAFSTDADNKEQDFLLGRVGFHGQTAIIVGFLNGERISTADAYAWNDRTMQTAHLYIEQHWDELKDGDVVCVEHILGERETPKISEREESYV
jgi:hypothetical protein